jgi:hypothetical protein
MVLTRIQQISIKPVGIQSWHDFRLLTIGLISDEVLEVSW